MMQLNKKTVLLAASGVSVACGLFAGVALARGEKEAPVGVSAPLLVRAINAASAAKAGDIAEVAVEKEKGKTLVSVDVLAADGQKYEVNVDASTTKVLSVEADKDDDKEGEDEGEG